MFGNRNRGRGPLVAAAVLIALGASGCVERRYTIRTDPPGALVYVNGEEIGPAPVSRSFTYYGAREIVVSADGYQTQKIIHPIRAPWWDNHLTDFFTENLVPVTLRDEREIHIKMTPATTPATGDLVARAEALRHQGRMAPPPRRGGILGFFGF